MTSYLGYTLFIAAFIVLFAGSSAYSEEAANPENYLLYTLSKSELPREIGLNLNYAEGRDMMSISNASLGYGCLGVYQGYIFGFIAGVMDLQNRPFRIAAVFSGIAIGGFLGSRADEPWEKNLAIGGAVAATVLLLSYVYAMIGD